MYSLVENEEKQVEVQGQPGAYKIQTGLVPLIEDRFLLHTAGGI